MKAAILDGKALAVSLRAALKCEIDDIRQQSGAVPVFANIVVGHDAGAASYAKSQQRTAEALGIDFRFLHLAATTTQQELNDQIALLNHDRGVHGIMLHKPLPEHIDFQAAVNAISVHKDLEGMNVANLGEMFLGHFHTVPCTPAAVMALLASSGIDPAGKDAVIVGRSEIVGKPLIHLLLQKNCTVSVCHSATSKAGRLAEHISRADILVAALGRPGLILGEWVRPGAVVIDVGINSVAGKITGDVEFASAAERAAFITPVPGGVGPVTAVCLMRNGVELFKRQIGFGV